MTKHSTGRHLIEEGDILTTQMRPLYTERPKSFNDQYEAEKRRISVLRDVVFLSTYSVPTTIRLPITSDIDKINEARISHALKQAPIAERFTRK